MGKIKGHSLIKEVRGRIGKDMYVRKSGSNTIVSRKGVVRRSSEGQQANRERFAQAALHARTMLIEPELNRAYTIMGMLQGIAPKNAAISDFLRQPEVESIAVENYQGNIGDTLFIRDKHVLKLTKVEVTIVAPDGTLIEQGSAVPWDIHWKYSATVQRLLLPGTRIVVTAFDRLRRKAEKTVYVG